MEGGFIGALRGTIHEGKVVFPKPTDLPEGTEVEVIPVDGESSLREAPSTPDEIARVLAAMDAAEPLEVSDAERDAIAVDRQARKEWEKARFDEHAAQLREIWE